MTWQPTPGAVERLFALQAEADLFEQLVAALAQQLLLPGDGAVDGGACYGRHTLGLARAVGPRGWVLAVEPRPALARRLALLLSPATGLPQVMVAAVALAAADGEASFHQITDGPEAGNYSGLRLRQVPELAAPSVAVLTVACRTLDSLAAGRERLAFVKLDLEGGEFDALRGGRQSLVRHRPAVVFECGRGNAAALYGYDASDYFGFFEAVGYRLFDIFGQPFGPADWTRPGVPYYRVAVPRGSGAEARVLSDLPGLVCAALSRDGQRRRLC